jgi:tetratricopeptide (TPR) repeat protein
MDSKMDNDVNDPVFQISKRLDSLENDFRNKKKSLIEKIGMWGGIIALALSLIISFVALYDRLISKPKEQEEQYREKLKEKIAKIQQINNNIAKINASKLKVEEKLQLESLAASEKPNFIESANQLIMKLKQNIGAADFYILGYEKANAGDFEGGRTYLEKAIEKTSDVNLKSECHRNLGKLFFMTKDDRLLDKARNEYSKSISLIVELKQWGRSAQLAYIYADWVIMEALCGNCDRAKKLYDKFKHYASSDDVLPDKYNQLISALRKGLKPCKKCQITLPTTRRGLHKTR